MGETFWFIKHCLCSNILIILIKRRNQLGSNLGYSSLALYTLGIPKLALELSFATQMMQMLYATNSKTRFHLILHCMRQLASVGIITDTFLGRYESTRVKYATIGTFSNIWPATAHVSQRQMQYVLKGTIWSPAVI